MPLVPKEVLFNDQGKQRTVSLVHELPSSADVEAIFTINPKGKEGLINLRKLFIDMVTDDPSEVSFAEFVFGDLEWWNEMAEGSLMKPIVRQWRMIADTRRKSQAFQSVIKEAKDGSGSTKVAAARFLIEEPWKKDVIGKQTKRKTTTDAYNSVSADLERLRQDGLLQ